MLQAKKEQPVVNVKARTFKFLLDVLRFFFALSILRSQILFCNRKSKQRLDRHETIVAERCETFRNYCIVGCQDDKCRVETPDEAAGVGGTNPELAAAVACRCGRGADKKESTHPPITAGNGSC